MNRVVMSEAVLAAFIQAFFSYGKAMGEAGLLGKLGVTEEMVAADPKLADSLSAKTLGVAIKMAGNPGKSVSEYLELVFNVAIQESRIDLLRERLAAGRAVDVKWAIRKLESFGIEIIPDMEAPDGTA